jgi:hypothetical protein
MTLSLAIEISSTAVDQLALPYSVQWFFLVSSFNLFVLRPSTASTIKVDEEESSTEAKPEKKITLSDVMK